MSSPMRWILCAMVSLVCGCKQREPKRPKHPPSPSPIAKRDASASSRKTANPHWKSFRPWTLRIELEHKGNHQAEKYRVVGLVREGMWPGSRTALVDPFDYGAHRFEIRDVRTGRNLYYSRGYSSLFGEWKTTKEAKTKTKAFSESLRIPFPRSPVELRIYSRDRRGKMRRVLRTTIDPLSPKVKLWKRRPSVAIKKLHISGPPEQRLDILILGDGYTAAEKEKFFRDSRRFSDAMLRNPGFGAHKRRMNIRALFVPSKVSGVSEPRKGRVLPTPLGLSFNTFGSARYLMTERNQALRDIAAHAPYDALYLMANTSRYGGGGIYNLYSTFPSDNEYDEYVFIHEFGHSFVGLGDEYYDSSVAYSDFYPKGVEPWEPNVTAFLRGKVKWRSLVSTGAPIPTPNRARYRNVVGLFEGAGYSAKGLYRPQLGCKMKGKGNTPFCGVCAKAISDRIALYSK